MFLSQSAPQTTTNALTNQPLTVYQWANKSAAQSDFLVTNPDGFQFLSPTGSVLGRVDAFRKYRALMLVVNKRMQNRWQAQVSYVYADVTGTVNNTSGSQTTGRQFETPILALINVNGYLTNSRPNEFKLLGGYRVPGIELAVNAYWRSISGQAWTPYQVVSSRITGVMPSSTERRPLIEPRGTERMPVENVLDLRLEKVLAFGNDRIGLYADLLNLANASTITGIQTRYPNITITGVANPVVGGAPGSVIAPRQVNVGARWSF